MKPSWPVGQTQSVPRNAGIPGSSITRRAWRGPSPPLAKIGVYTPIFASGGDGPLQARLVMDDPGMPAFRGTDWVCPTGQLGFMYWEPVYTMPYPGGTL